MIVAKSLHKAYGPRKAVDDISFMAPDFEVFGLLGPNGAGKTTTMHMLAGIDRPDKGQIAINGQKSPNRAEVRRAVGIAPQAISVYEDLTAEENLRFFAALYGVRGDSADRAVRWLLGFVGLDERAGDRVSTYSGGMVRRLNLACALVHEPGVVLLDEPMVGVDPQSRNRLLDCIRRLRDAGCSIVYTTHSMEEAQTLCDQVAIMDEGRIMALGSVAELIAKFGGRPRVSLTLAEVPADAANLPGTLDGTNLEFEADAPLEAVRALEAGGLSSVSVNIRPPNLESAFLNLTGHSLRD